MPDKSSLEAPLNSAMTDFTNLLLVYITAPTQAVALEIAKGLVNAGLAAGANISGPMHSIYRWQQKIHDSEEWQIFIQTRKEDFEILSQFVADRHPYKVPCIIGAEITNGFAPFLSWIATAGATCN